MKRVLLVAYHYPPEGGSSGVLRSLKFSKYLPRHGWIPHVLTLRPTFYRVRDEALLGDVPREAVLHRTFALDTARHLAWRGRHFAWMATPDRFVSWIPFGVGAGLAAIRRHAIDAIYSTSPPATSHLIALLLRDLTGRPWIADFRDPWIEDGQHPKPGTLRFRLELALERRVLRRASRVVATTPRLAAELGARHRIVPAAKFRVVWNGYDEDDFADATEGSADRFVILHAGLVTPDFRDPDPLLTATAALIETDELPREETSVVFLGGGAYLQSPRFRDRIAALGLGDVVRVEERVSHHEALRRQADAAVLLLLQASEDTRSLIPAKAFEYLRLGRPVLALTYEGATSELLAGQEACHAVDPRDEAGLRATLRVLYRTWKSGGTRGRIVHPVERYERRRLTETLAHLLDELTPVSGPRE